MQFTMITVPDGVSIACECGWGVTVDSAAEAARIAEAHESNVHG